VKEVAVYSDSTLALALGEVREAYRTHGRVKVKLLTGKRSMNQNDISHAWYAELALQDRQEDARGHRRYCKLHHGVPIMREDDDFRTAYDAVIKPLSYELKLQAMDCWPVTSLMDKAQMSKFLEAVREDYRRRQIFVEFPS
jgi:hypothetical protein